MPGKDGTLQAREFLFECEDQAMAQLGDGLPPIERRVMWTILQLHFGDPAVHFELHPQPSRRQIELGLHFEGAAEANDAWAGRLSALAGDLIPQLGSAWELEAWTLSWRRLHRVYPFDRLTHALCREVATELARAMRILGPIVCAAAVERGPSASPRTKTRARASTSP